MMATEIKQGLYYSDEHEWVRVDGEHAYIGITSYAQHHLGDIVFVELPDIDSEFEAGEVIGVIESVKAVSDMHTPVSGIVVAVNEKLEGAPESLNDAPYQEHIAVIKMDNQAELDDLMDPDEYVDYCEKEEE